MYHNPCSTSQVSPMVYISKFALRSLPHNSTFNSWATGLYTHNHVSIYTSLVENFRILRLLLTDFTWIDKRLIHCKIHRSFTLLFLIQKWILSVQRLDIIQQIELKWLYTVFELGLLSYFESEIIYLSSILQLFIYAQARLLQNQR